MYYYLKNQTGDDIILVMMIYAILWILCLPYQNTRNELLKNEDDDKKVPKKLKKTKKIKKIRKPHKLHRITLLKSKGYLKLHESLA